MSSNLDKLYRNKEHPYYVYAPRWIDTSAGIRALHYLCHALNSSGGKAYLVLSESNIKGIPRVSGFLNTPILSQEIADSHFRANLTPITIYSETVPGNPLKAPFVIRYLMNYIGALSGTNKFADSELMYAFSTNIARDAEKKLGIKSVPTLFIPPVDPRDFEFSIENRQDLVAIYAAKYRAFVGVPPSLDGINSIEIFRQGKEAQRREEVIELLGKVKAVITFENSSIVTEAILSGTPAFFQPNDFLTEAIAEHELGWEGTGWGWSAENFANAKATVSQGRDKYLASIDEFFEKLNGFIVKTQEESNDTNYETRLIVPSFDYLINGHRVRLAIQILRFGGFRKLSRVTIDFVKRRVTYKYWLNHKKELDKEILGF